MTLSLLVVTSVDSAATYLRQEALPSRDGTSSGLARQPEATFADRLKAHRLAAGLTLMGLAERVGVPHQRVCDYECGRYPQWRTLVGLVEVLGVEVVGRGGRPVPCPSLLRRVGPTRAGSIARRL
jgi:hypothetical protein